MADQIKTSPNAQNLRATVAAIGAHNVPTFPGLWRYFDEETQTYWECTTADLVDLGERLASGGNPAHHFSVWSECAREVEE